MAQQESDGCYGYNYNIETKEITINKVHNTLPENMKELLPTPEEIAMRLKIFEKEDNIEN